MVKASNDHVAEREERLRKLARDIDAAILDSESERDLNVLAIIMLIRAMDIFVAQYDDQEFRGIIADAMEDRAKARHLPATQEYVAKQAAMAKWLP